MKKIKEEIKNYETLENNYDGYDGKPAKPEIVKTALYLINLIKKHKFKLPKEMLSPSGTIGLYWNHNVKAIYIEINIDEEDHYSYFIKDSNIILGKDDCLVNNIDDQLRDFLEKISVA